MNKTKKKTQPIVCLRKTPQRRSQIKAHIDHKTFWLLWYFHNVIKKGEVYRAGYKSLEELFGVHQSIVSRGVESLEKKGELIVTRKKDPLTGRNLPNTIRIDPRSTFNLNDPSAFLHMEEGTDNKSVATEKASPYADSHHIPLTPNAYVYPYKGMHTPIDIYVDGEGDANLHMALAPLKERLKNLRSSRASLAGYPTECRAVDRLIAGCEAEIAALEDAR